MKNMIPLGCIFMIRKMGLLMSELSVCADVSAKFSMVHEYLKGLKLLTMLRAHIKQDFYFFLGLSFKKKVSIFN